jgi:hypothetical protein
MVLRLSQALDLPLRDRNQMLELAGLAAAYREERLETADLKPFRTAIERLLKAHEPYPAMVLDRYWNVLAANEGSFRLFGSTLVGTNMVRQYANSRDAIANWPAVARAGLWQLRRQLDQSPFDPELRALVDLAEAAVAEWPRTSEETDLVVCPEFRLGDKLVRTITVAARFDNPLEVTLAELRIELTYPMDEDAERFFRSSTSAGAQYKSRQAGSTVHS